MPRVDQAEIDTRFSYHTPKDGAQAAKYAEVRKQAKAYAEFLVANTPESREQSLALTALEEAVMWANAAIARRET